MAGISIYSGVHERSTTSSITRYLHLSVCSQLYAPSLCFGGIFVTFLIFSSNLLTASRDLDIVMSVEMSVIFNFLIVYPSSYYPENPANQKCSRPKLKNMATKHREGAKFSVRDTWRISHFFFLLLAMLHSKARK